MALWRGKESVTGSTTIGTEYGELGVSVGVGPHDWIVENAGGKGECPRRGKREQGSIVETGEMV